MHMEAKKDEMFPRDPNKTYSLMAIVEGGSFSVEKGPEDTVQSWPHLLVREPPACSRGGPHGGSLP